MSNCHVLPLRHSSYVSIKYYSASLAIVSTVFNLASCHLMGQTTLNDLSPALVCRVADVITLGRVGAWPTLNRITC